MAAASSTTIACVSKLIARLTVFHGPSCFFRRFTAIAATTNGLTARCLSGRLGALRQVARALEVQDDGAQSFWELHPRPSLWSANFKGLGTQSLRRFRSAAPASRATLARCCSGARGSPDLPRTAQGFHLGERQTKVAARTAGSGRGKRQRRRRTICPDVEQRGRVKYCQMAPQEWPAHVFKAVRRLLACRAFRLSRRLSSSTCKS